MVERCHYVENILRTERYWNGLGDKYVSLQDTYCRIGNDSEHVINTNLPN